MFRVNKLKDYSIGMEIVDYAKLSIHLGGGSWTPITLKIKPELVSRVVDCFGKEVEFKKRSDNYVEARFLSSTQKVRYGLLNMFQGAR